LTNPAYKGQAASGRLRTTPARRRKSALEPVGRGVSTRAHPPQEWIIVPVPALVATEQFDLVQRRLATNQQSARRSTTHPYLLRGLVSCGICRLSCSGVTRAATATRYRYYRCLGKQAKVASGRASPCTARFIPATQLDELVWADLRAVLQHPELVAQALERAHSGAWVPQELRRRQATLRGVLTSVARQRQRLLEAYLAEVVDLAAFQRQDRTLGQQEADLLAREREVAAQGKRLVGLSAIAQSMTAVLEQLRVGLDRADFQQRRQLVELLIDRVVVTDGQVEIRYVVPTTPGSTKTRFCHLRTDYFDAGATAVAQLQGGDVGVGLVGDEDLEAVPVGVGEAELGAGVGIFAAADRPRARRPAREVQGRKLGDLGTQARLALAVDGGYPGGGGDRQDRGADTFIGRQADREPDATRVQVVSEGMSGTAGVGADQDRLVTGGRWELRQGQLDDVDVVSGGVGAGIARPQDPAQGLAGAVTAVQVGQQRVEAKAALVGPGRALLVGMGVQQGAVHVDDQQALDVRTGPPGRRSGVGPGRMQPGEPVGITSDPLDDPPRRRCGRDWAKQLRLLAEDGQVAQAVATVGEHHRQVPQHHTRIVAVAVGLGAARPPAQRASQPESVGQLTQQRRAGMPGDPVAVAGDFEPWARPGSLHPQGALLRVVDAT
jgi:hypothetical protein